MNPYLILNKYEDIVCIEMNQNYNFYNFVEAFP